MKCTWCFVAIVSAFLAGFVLSERNGDAQLQALADQSKPDQPSSSDAEKQQRGRLLEEILHPTTKAAGSTAYRELKQSHQDHVTKLMDAVDADESDVTRYFASRLLGRYRDRRAIWVLVKNLDWRCHNSIATVQAASPLTGFPCAEAIAEYGTEGAVPVLHDLARKKEASINEEMLRLRVHLLEAAYPNRVEWWGRDDVIGVVERYIERIPPQWPASKRNVERLLEMLKKRP